MRQRFARGISGVVAAVLVLVGLHAALAAPPPPTSPTPPAPSSTPAIPAGWTTSTHSINVGGINYSYLVTMPTHPGSQPLPVVLVLHGFGVTPAFEETRMDFPAVTGPAILVYPAGYKASWDAGACCGAAWGQGVNDVLALTTIIHDVEATIPAAANQKVDVAGYSNGGKMALLLADHVPQLIAAVAVYGATAVFSQWNSPPPVSMMELASTGDPEVTIGPLGAPVVQDGFTEPTVVAETVAYRRVDGCAGKTVAANQGSLGLTTWLCSGNQEVAMGLYQGGSHNWPRGTDGSPSGQAVMWQFFQSVRNRQAQS